MKKTLGNAGRRPSASSANKKKTALKRPSARQRKRPFCFVYVLGARTPRGPITYVGWTVDLDQRVAAHNASTGAKFTKGLQWALLYAEAFADRGQAMSREWHLKRDRLLRQRLRALL